MEILAAPVLVEPMPIVKSLDNEPFAHAEPIPLVIHTQTVKSILATTIHVVSMQSVKIQV